MHVQATCGIKYHVGMFFIHARWKVQGFMVFPLLQATLTVGCRWVLLLVVVVYTSCKVCQSLVHLFPVLCVLDP